MRGTTGADGDDAGAVIDAAHNTNGDVEALLVRLDSGGWIRHTAKERLRFDPHTE